MQYRKNLILAALAILLVASTGLVSCSVSTDGPAMSGASHGALGSQDMCDYYYKKEAGWTYTFACYENVYNPDGSIANSYQGANETVYTMGFDGFAPNGDSLFRYQINYQITSDYWMNGDMPGIPMNYLPATRSDRTHGAWVMPTYNVDGMHTMALTQRPVSCDTILAGVVGYVRSLTSNIDGSNTNDLVDCTDTLWCTSHLDTVFLWERLRPGSPMVKERAIFLRNFTTNSSWTYDVINNPNPTTVCIVANADSRFTVPNTVNTYNHVATMRIKTAEVDDHDFNREYRYYACGVGIVYEYDWFYTTTDGFSFTKKDFARSLISLSHS